MVQGLTEEKAMVPGLRFSEFNVGKNYSTYLFEDVFLFSSGKNIKQNEASPEYKTPCVRYGELYHLYDEVITQVVNKTNLDETELTFSEGNEILLPSAGEDPLDIGSASALTLKNVAIGRTINVLRPKNEVTYSHIYVSYYINQKLRKKISTLARGASISNVYNSDLKRLKINLPEIEEQQKIASFLTAVDEKLNQLRYKRDCLQTYKRGVMQKIYAQKIRFTKDDGSAFPDWEERPLKQIFEEVTTKVGERNIETYSITAGKGFVSQREKFGKDISGQQNPNYTCLAPDEFSYNKGNSKTFKYGCVYLNKNNFNIAVPNVFISFRKIDLKTSSFFYEKLFEFHYLDRYLRKIISSSARMDGLLNINKSYFFDINLPYPHADEQKKIADFLTVIDIKVDAVGQQITEAETFKKGLLQKMFM